MLKRNASGQDAGEIIHLEAANKLLKKQNEELKELLEAALKAKENGCHRGQYCLCCKHAVLIYNRCYCTFKQCENFEKERSVIE